MYLNLIKKLLLAILFISFIYSCQNSKEANSDNNLEKLKFEKKVIQVDARVIKPAVFSKEILSNGIISPCKKAKLVFKANENILNVYVKNGQ